MLFAYFKINKINAKGKRYRVSIVTQDKLSPFIIFFNSPYNAKEQANIKEIHGGFPYLIVRTSTPVNAKITAIH